jgi:hypothetical protein
LQSASVVDGYPEALRRCQRQQLADLRPIHAHAEPPLGDQAVAAGGEEAVQRVDAGSNAPPLDPSDRGLRDTRPERDLFLRESGIAPCASQSGTAIHRLSISLLL